VDANFFSGPWTRCVPVIFLQRLGPARQAGSQTPGAMRSNAAVVDRACAGVTGSGAAKKVWDKIRLDPESRSTPRNTTATPTNTMDSSAAKQPFFSAVVGLYQLPTLRVCPAFRSDRDARGRERTDSTCGFPVDPRLPGGRANTGHALQQALRLGYRQIKPTIEGSRRAQH
jgi:hypothetical protein